MRIRYAFRVCVDFIFVKVNAAKVFLNAVRIDYGYADWTCVTVERNPNRRIPKSFRKRERFLAEAVEIPNLKSFDGAQIARFAVRRRLWPTKLLELITDRHQNGCKRLIAFHWNAFMRRSKAHGAVRDVYTVSRSRIVSKMLILNDSGGVEDSRAADDGDYHEHRRTTPSNVYNSIITNLCATSTPSLRSSLPAR